MVIKNSMISICLRNDFWINMWHRETKRVQVFLFLTEADLPYQGHGVVIVLLCTNHVQFLWCLLQLLISCFQRHLCHFNRLHVLRFNCSWHFLTCFTDQLLCCLAHAFVPVLLHLLLPFASVVIPSAFAAAFCPLLPFQAQLLSAILLRSVSPSCSCNGFLCNGYISHRPQNSDTVFHNTLCYNSVLSKWQLLFAQHDIFTKKPRLSTALLCESIKAAFATCDRLSYFWPLSPPDTSDSDTFCQ